MDSSLALQMIFLRRDVLANVMSITDDFPDLQNVDVYPMLANFTLSAGKASSLSPRWFVRGFALFQYALELGCGKPRWSIAAVEVNSVDFGPYKVLLLFVG